MAAVRFSVEYIIKKLHKINAFISLITLMFDIIIFITFTSLINSLAQAPDNSFIILVSILFRSQGIMRE